MGPNEHDQSTLLTAVGLLVAVVAIVGTQLLGWEWGSGGVVPTTIGVVIAGIAVLIAANRALS